MFSHRAVVLDEGTCSMQWVTLLNARMQVAEDGTSQHQQPLLHARPSRVKSIQGEVAWK